MMFVTLSWRGLTRIVAVFENCPNQIEVLYPEMAGTATRLSLVPSRVSAGERFFLVSEILLPLSISFRLRDGFDFSFP